MKVVRIIGMLFGLTVLPVLSLSAYTVSFIVVETGLTQEDPAEASRLWENGLLDVFFDAGHIVSNARIARIEADVKEQTLPEDIQAEYDEAVEGGAQFFILVLLDYTGNRNSVPRPQDISIRLFRTNPYRLVLEQKYPGRRTTPIREETEAAKNAARRLIPQVR